MRLLNAFLVPRWAVRIALAAAVAWQTAFVAAVYVITGGDGIYYGAYSPGLPAPAPAALVHFVNASASPGGDLLDRLYDSPALVYPMVLECAAGLVSESLRRWVPVLLAVIVNVQFWTLAALAPLVLVRTVRKN